MASPGSRAAGRIASRGGAAIAAGGESAETIWGEDIATRNFSRDAKLAYGEVETPKKGAVGTFSAGLNAISMALFGVQLIAPAAGKMGRWKRLENTGFGKGLSRFSEVAVGHLDPNTGHEIPGVLNSKVGELHETLDHLGFKQSSKKAASMGASLSKVSNKISPKLTNLFRHSTVVDAGLATTSVVVEAIDTIHDLSQSKKALISMNSDITGKKLSASQIYFGSKEMDPAVAAVRKRELLDPKAIISRALKIGGTIAASYLFMRGGAIKHGQAWAFGTILGTNFLGSALRGPKATDAYRNLAQSIKQTGEAPVEQYEALLGALQPHSSPKVIHEIAEQAHKDKLHPGQIMQFYAQKGSELKPVAAAAKEDKKIVGEHTAAVQNQKSMHVVGKDKEVLGQHTAAALGQKPATELAGNDTKEPQEVLGAHTGKVVSMDSKPSAAHQVA